MEDDFKDYGRYSFFREYPDEPDFPDSLDGMQLAMGPTPDKDVQAALNMPLETSTQTTMRRMQEDQQAGVTGQILPEERTLRQNLAYKTQQALIDNLGLDNARARKLAETIFGGESSGAPLGVGLVDFTPAVIPMAVQESGISAGQARESAGRGEYGTAAAQYGIGVLQGAEAIPGVKLATTAAKKIGSTIAPQVGEAFERYAATTGLTNYIVQPKRSLNTLVKKLESGTMDEQSYIESTKILNDALQRKPEKVNETDKRRGADEITRRLLGALSPTAQVQLEEPVARFGKWLLDNNPQLANDLGIAITKSGESGMAGGYESFDRIATIIADKANPGTVVHEILHHSEQMMPIEVQNGVADAWTNAYLKAFKDADPKTQKYLALIPKAISNPGARKVLFDGFKRGDLDYNTHYQLVNPSEFWAVNATRIMSSRYEAGSWIGKAKVWLNEFAEKSKGAFGLPSDSPVLRGLKSVTKGSGKIETDMLTDPLNVYDSMTRVADRAKKSEQRKSVVKKVVKGAATTATGVSLTGDKGQK